MGRPFPPGWRQAPDVCAHREFAAMNQRLTFHTSSHLGKRQRVTRVDPPMGERSSGLCCHLGPGGWRQLATDCPMSTFARFPSSAEWRSPGCQFIRHPIMAGISRMSAHAGPSPPSGANRTTLPTLTLWRQPGAVVSQAPGHPAIRPLLFAVPPASLSRTGTSRLPSPRASRIRHHASKGRANPEDSPRPRGCRSSRPTSYRLAYIF